MASNTCSIRRARRARRVVAPGDAARAAWMSDCLHPSTVTPALHIPHRIYIHVFRQFTHLSYYQRYVDK